MTDYTEVLRAALKKDIEELSFKCKGCPRVSQCEDQGTKGESRYCWPLIEAAILGEPTWYTLHRSPNAGIERPMKPQKDA
jgi:hypothetical protein